MYLQASKGASPLASGIDLLGLAIVIPIASFAAGVLVEVVGRYRPHNYVGWSLILIGFGVLTLLDEHSSKALYVGLQVPLSAGLGIVWVSAQPSTLR